MRVHLRLAAPEVPGVESLFEAVDQRWPSVRSLGISLCTHLAIAWVLSMVSFPPPRVQTRARRPLDPTEIRIGDRLYYVSRIAPRETASPAEAKAPARRAAVSKKAPNQKRPSREAPAVAQAAPPSPPRAFIPPEFKRDPLAQQTLIQPDSAPNIRPQDPDVPSFKIWSAEVPQLHRKFVAPGQRTAPAENPQLLAEPSFDLTAPARQVNLNPQLTLQPRPAPLDLPSAPENPQLPSGDPLNIVSISNRPALPDNFVKVPPGNVVAESKPGPVAGASSAAESGSGASPAPAKPAAESGNSTASASAQQPQRSANQSSGDAAPAAGSKGAPGRDANGPSASQAVADGTAIASNRGSSREGPGGSPNTVPGTGTATASTAAAAPKQIIINRPPGGNFDTVIVQSSPLDLFPEGRNLLSGRPVYTVYIAVGTAKDWSLYFCVAGEKPPDAAPPSGIVVLNSPPPVKAPYPTHIVRPDVSLPKYEKYVLLHAIVNEAGRFRELRVVNAGSEQTDQVILAAVNGWEFRPASRDGVPVAVEVLLAIPAAGL